MRDRSWPRNGWERTHNCRVSRCHPPCQRTALGHSLRELLPVSVGLGMVGQGDEAAEVGRAFKIPKDRYHHTTHMLGVDSGTLGSRAQGDCWEGRAVITV